ncbi:hypothetical protein [Timonella senegalensis]|uniref:hypothetical protein n=1 Tax=Timonella senegalensis TaxID=1465825 RepID=UPI0002EE86D6|nr:hypothetical protein [Timonella senegalensis]
MTTLYDQTKPATVPVTNTLFLHQPNSDEEKARALALLERTGNLDLREALGL